MEAVVFAIAGAICLLGAFGVVLFRNPVHSALSLVATLFGVAVVFIALNAEFLAAVQVIVYAGAIVVMFLFVIMLLGVDRSEDLTEDPLPGQRPAGLVVGLLVAVGLILVASIGVITGKLSSTGAIVTGTASQPAPDNVVQLARVPFTTYLYPFEITSVLLVIGVVGAVVLARHRKDALVDDGVDAEVGS